MPLSKLIRWGTAYLHRPLDDDPPSVKYSDLLERLWLYIKNGKGVLITDIRGERWYVVGVYHNDVIDTSGVCGIVIPEHLKDTTVNARDVTEIQITDIKKVHSCLTKLTVNYAFFNFVRWVQSTRCNYGRAYGPIDCVPRDGSTEIEVGWLSFLPINSKIRCQLPVVSYCDPEVTHHCNLNGVRFYGVGKNPFVNIPVMESRYVQDTN